MAFPHSTAARWCALGLLLFGPAAAPGAQPAGPMWVYVGTYTGKDSKGIYRLDYDPATGRLGNPRLAARATNPSFLAVHPSGKFLYAVGEIDDFAGKKAGGVMAYSIDPQSGNLRLINEKSSGGPGPCHLVVDKAGRNVLVANYGGGSAAVLPIKDDGSLGEATSVVQHKGSSVNKDRQEGPHAHSINLSPDNRYAFVADLGLDEVVIYKFDADKGTLTPHGSAKVKPGSGPRHFAFDPKGKQAFVINELANTLDVFDYFSKEGKLMPLQSLTTLPKDFKEPSYCAEVQVHPSGKFAYGSNRGHNSVAVFAQGGPGLWRLASVQGQDIKTPRGFGIDPAGKFLLVGNQDSDSIVVFAIDPKTGALRPTGTKVEVPMPVCVKFVAKPQP